MANKDLKTRTPISNAVNTELLNQLSDHSKKLEYLYLNYLIKL